MTDTMNEKRFQQMLAAYGATPSRWPDDERAAAEAFAGIYPHAAALLGDADAVDALLFAHRAPAPSRALQVRVIASAPRRGLRRQLRFWWTGLAFATAAASGALVGSAATAALLPVATHFPLDEHEEAPAYEDAGEDSNS